MAKHYTLKKLRDFLTDQIDAIASLRREVAEIQVGFNSAYVEWKAEHDAALERLTDALSTDFELVGTDLKELILAREGEEKRLIAERREALRTTLIPEARQAADAAVAEGQALAKRLREANPRLDAREEQLKLRRQGLEEQLATLNAQIKQMSGCLGVVINYFKVNRADRERRQVIGRLEGVQESLRDVREQWDTLRAETASEQAEYQAQWQELTLEAAQYQSELALLDDPSSAAALARKRAVRHVIDNLKEPAAAGRNDLQTELNQMITYNIQTDDYQDGLGAVGGILGLLDGLVEGFERFRESVESLIEEQEMHASYLSTLEVAVDDEVLSFNKGWANLTKLVVDDAHLSQNPKEFLTAVQPQVDVALSEARIQGMFDSLGGSLQQATQRWS